MPKSPANWTYSYLRSARRFLETLGPYQPLLVLAVPLAIVEPLKLVALFVEAMAASSAAFLS
jgi:hypothetical protein